MPPKNIAKSTTSDNVSASPVNTTDIEKALALQDMSLQELLAKAKALGVKVSSTEKQDVIAAIIAGASDQQVVRNGYLVALHTRDDRALAVVKKAQAAIVQNRDAGQRMLELMLFNPKTGEHYTQRAFGAKIELDSVNIPDLQHACSLAGDGELNQKQNEVIRKFQEDPSAFAELAVVRVQRQDQNNPQRTNNFVMLYIRERGARVAATTF